MPSFDPNAKEHDLPPFVDEPGNYLMMITQFWRYRTRREHDAINVTAEVLHGPKKGATLRRSYMLSGPGTSWTAGLFKAVRAPVINDYLDDAELSRVIGERAFIAHVVQGEEMSKKPGHHFMEIENVSPLPDTQRSILSQIRRGLGTQANIAVEPPDRRTATPKGAEQPPDDIPHPADYGPPDPDAWNFG